MKKIIKYVLLLIIVLTVTSCGYTKEEEIEFKEIEIKARENATKYIKKKYGFTPKVISSTAEKEKSDIIIRFSPPPTGYATVECSYKSNKFKVYINGDDKEIDGFDDYQKDEIFKDVGEYIKEKTGLEAYKTSIKYRSTTDDYLVKDLYEKESIEEFIKNNEFKIIVEYINQKNLEYVKQQNLFNLDKTDMLLVNYNSISNYEQAKRFDDNFDNIKGRLNQNALYIESAYLLSNFIDHSTSDYYKFNIKEIDDIIYFNSQSDVNGDMTLSKDSIVDINKLLDSDSCKNLKQESDVYKVNWINNNGNNKPEFYIFIKKKDFEKYKNKNIYLGIECDNNYQLHNSFVEVGDYYYNSYDNSYALCKDKQSIKFTFVSKNCQN